MQKLEGTIKQVIFKKEDFLIASFLTKNAEEVVIKGSILGVNQNENINVYGEWENHQKFGKQFNVQRWERPIPKTKEQIIKFLSSGLIKQCGKKRAKQIVNHLGDNTLQIIMENGAHCLASIKGIGQKRAESISQSVKETFEIQTIMMELLPYGITTNMVMKAYKKFGSNTVETIKRNPYELTKLSLIGFQKADEIAQRIGISPLSSFRIEACADYALKEFCYRVGHCYLPEEELIMHTLKMLNHNVISSRQVQETEVFQALAVLEEHERIINENGNIFPKFLYKHESHLALKLAKLVNLRGSRDGEALPKIEQKIKKYQRKEKMVLAEKQREAVRRLMQENLLILTGGPGTGKTATVKTVIDVYQSLHPRADIALAAPTGRASRKLAEVTGMFDNSSTIHRLIGYRQGEDPENNSSNPLPFDLIVVDEVSMMDVQLASLLFDAIPSTARVLLVGDQDQLPSVGAGNVLKDMLEADLPHVRLTEVFRQAQESQIVTNAHLINQGKNIVINSNKDDFYFLEQSSPEGIAGLIKKSVLRFIEIGYSYSDILVLSPMKKGVIGTEALNKVLQETLNGRAFGKEEIKFGDTIFREGDKVLQNKNNRDKDVYNGDIGVIERIDDFIDEDGNRSNEKALYCRFHSQEVIYTKEEFKELQLAYAITVHKSQGGQAPIVLIPVATQHYIMLLRNLIYTGITRAEQKVVLVGTKKALNIAIQNNKSVQRNTQLATRIQYHLRYSKAVNNTESQIKEQTFI